MSTSSLYHSTPFPTYDKVEEGLDRYSSASENLVLNEQVYYASNIAASKISRGLPSAYQHLYSKEDLAQLFYLHYLTRLQSDSKYYDTEGSATYWYRAFIYHGKNLLLRIYDEADKTDILISDFIQKHKENSTMSGVSGILCLTEEIEGYCRKFAIPFSKKKPVSSLIRVLKVVLNEFTDEEFYALPEDLQKRLVYLGDVLAQRNVKLCNKGDSIAFDGVVEEVRKLFFQENITTLYEIEKKLIERGYLYNAMNLKSLVRKYRKQQGLPKEEPKKSNITVASLIEEAINEGHTTPKEVFKYLRSKGKNVAVATINTQFYQVRKKLNSQIADNTE